MREEQLILRKAFVTVSRKVLTDTRLLWGLEDPTGDWKLTEQAQQHKVQWGWVTVGVYPRGQCWVPPCSDSLMI